MGRFVALANERAGQKPHCNSLAPNQIVIDDREREKVFQRALRAESFRRAAVDLAKLLPTQSRVEQHSFSLLAASAGNNSATSFSCPTRLDSVRLVRALRSCCWKIFETHTHTRARKVSSSSISLAATKRSHHKVVISVGRPAICSLAVLFKLAKLD